MRATYIWHIFAGRRKKERNITHTRRNAHVNSHIPKQTHRPTDRRALSLSIPLTHMHRDHPSGILTKTHAHILLTHRAHTHTAGYRSTDLRKAGARWGGGGITLAAPARVDRDPVKRSRAVWRPERTATHQPCRQLVHPPPPRSTPHPTLPPRTTCLCNTGAVARWCKGRGVAASQR